ncbi:uncharacterized protein LOC126903925 [Daktulosphaira vitifoliae]|uniref:uncharacterized protein LOC126903925 n=1 Tax=Daktulosphaira vitifoliae TaxID=58002 RepID=UPI0021A9F5EA|nr:uncharacterized protein LOC126903925 [Daktulosphaira vitifoliae]
MASENNTDSHIYETNMNVVKRRVEEFWNRRFMSSNLVVDSPEEPQTSRQSKANSSGNINTETNTAKPKKQTYHKQLESDEIIAEKVSFHKNHLHRNKCDDKKQPIEISFNDNGGPHIESNLSEEHDEVIKKLEANNEPTNDVTLSEVSTDKVKETLEEKIINLEPTKCGVKVQLLEIASSESPNLKRKSSEKDEKIIKKAKISSELLHATTSNDVTLSEVSSDKVKETLEKKKINLEPTKYEVKVQLLEIASSESPNLKRKSSEKDEKIIKKAKISSELLHATTSNDVTLSEVSSDKVKETLEKKKINLEPTKYEVKVQLLEIASSESPNLKRKSSEKDEKIIKKAKISSELLHATTSNDVTLSEVSSDKVKETLEKKKINLEPTKYEVKEQLLEIASSESPNLKRKSSEKDEKIIKKSKVSSEVSPSNMNDVLPAVSVVEIDEIPEKEIEVTHDSNTNELDQYNAPSFKSPKSWYTSDTINDYLKLIVKRSNGEVHAVVTDFIPAYLRGGYPAVRKWIKKDIHTLKFLFVPMNVLGGHWILTVINVPERTVTSYDSLKSYDGPYPMVLKEYLTDWEMDKKGAASSWTLKIGETTRQTNGYDCGPFTVELAEKMARGDTTPINASLMPSVRLRHREEIIAGQLFL